MKVSFAALAASVLALGVAPPTSAQRCSIADIKIKSISARYEDPCKRKSCPVMRGVAVLTNGCAGAIGVQLKIVGLDDAGAPVAARDFWPASISNIPPGDYTISLDHSLEVDTRIKRFTLQPIRVQRWPDR